MNGSRYVLRYGIPWDAMPKNLPPSSICYDYWRRFDTFPTDSQIMTPGFYTLQATISHPFRLANPFQDDDHPGLHGGWLA